MNPTIQKCPVILQTGFRIFFLGASIYAVVSMAIWMAFYVAGRNIFVAMPLTVWHGHEMIFGFTMAVVAGFLLTAVTNWTGKATLKGLPLLVLFMFWLSARILAFMPAAFPQWPFVVCNLSFVLYLTVAVMRPIISVKQWKQSAVFSKLILLFISLIVFYVALFQAQLMVERKSLRFAVYMLVSLIFTIGRRIMPFFIERGVDYSVTLKNNKTIDLLSIVSLIIFSLFDVFWPQPVIILLSSFTLVVVHSMRLFGWYTKGIWKKPLLWILFAGYLFLIVGFIFKGLSILAHKPDDAAMHAWTAGGIGLFTLGMMARVSWGHTGRNIAQPPKTLTLIFVLIMASAVFRVFLPIVNESHYIMWIAISQLFWILAFALFLWSYFKILILPRPDGKFG